MSGVHSTAKRDFRAEQKSLYAPPTARFTTVDVPAFDFLMVDGHGDPNTSAEYADAVGLLYALAYGAKFASKQQLGQDYAVMPLEGLWFADTPEAFIARDKDSWSWTMMLRQPVALPDDIWAAVRTTAAAKAEAKAIPLSALDAVRLESFAEGFAVQIMHIGSYDAEAPTIAAMHEWIANNGFAETGHHHEIYIGDPRRSKPDKLRTILRQPISSR
jgi:hypothetical protein